MEANGGNEHAWELDELNGESIESKSRLHLYTSPLLVLMVRIRSSNSPNRTSCRCISTPSAASQSRGETLSRARVSQWLGRANQRATGDGLAVEITCTAQTPPNSTPIRRSLSTEVVLSRMPNPTECVLNMHSVCITPIPLP